MLNIINYFVKILTITIGLILLTGIFFGPAINSNPMLRVMGIVLIVWGVYRLIIYRAQSKRYTSMGNDDEEENEDTK